MGRPIKTNIQYLREYRSVLREIAAGTSYRTISRVYGVGVSTVWRLSKRFF